MGGAGSMFPNHHAFSGEIIFPKLIRNIMFLKKYFDSQNGKKYSRFKTVDFQVVELLLV